MSTFDARQTPNRRVPPGNRCKHFVTFFLEPIALCPEAVVVCIPFVVVGPLNRKSFAVGACWIDDIHLALAVVQKTLPGDLVVGTWGFSKICGV